MVAPVARRVVLVDGSALIVRAWFVVPADRSTAAGLPTNVLDGLATSLKKARASRAAALGAVVFDPPGKSRREEADPRYHAWRPELPPGLIAQLPLVPRMVKAFGFPLVRLDGFEASDVIATLTARAVAAGHEVVLIAADRRTSQLVRDPSVKMQDTLRDVTYDEELVRKKWGAKPAALAELLALSGYEQYAAGVKGIGEKTAAGLLAAHGSLEGVYGALAQLKPKQREALLAARDDVFHGRDAVRLLSDAPIDVDLDSLPLQPIDATELNSLLGELELHAHLLSPSHRERAGGGPANTIVCESRDQSEAALSAFAGTRPVLLALSDDLPRRARFAGLLVATPERAVFVPPPALPGARAFLESAAAPKLTHDAKSLDLLLRRQGLALRGVTLDLMLASYLAQPTKILPHRLDQIAQEYLQRVLPPLKSLTGKRALDAVPAAECAAFLAPFAAAALDVAPILEQRLAALGLRRLHDELELPLARVLAAMEADGVRVESADLAAAGEEFASKRAAAETEAFRLAGHALNLGSPKQLGTVLFDELKLPVLRRTKTGYATDSDVLERLADRHPIVAAILEWRKYEKLINTYTDVLRAAIDPADGRIHATLQQTASASGRLIATEPDLQRTPVRTAEGKRIRRAFVAPPGMRLIAADWSQIELRVLAHVSGDEALTAAFREGADVHRRTAGELFGVAPPAVTHEQRGVGKTVNFATIYGQGASALGQILGIARAEAADYIEKYFRTYAGVRAWLDRTIEEAHACGYVTTITGRRRWIPELASNNPVDRQAGERIAANTPIQGSAADLCKMAMVRIAGELESAKMRTRMLVQVHDELLFEAPEGEVERAVSMVKRGMESVGDLKVPLLAEIGVGASWADAKE